MRGFILYSCVPNTTHVTQETDQNHGPFKTQFSVNLELIVAARLEADFSLSLGPKFVGLPVRRIRTKPKRTRNFVYSFKQWRRRLGKSINSLTVAELDVLLSWHQTTKTKGAKKADKLEQWKQILESGK